MGLPILPLAGKALGGLFGMISGNRASKDEAEKAASEERRDGIKDEIALIVLVLPFLAAFVPQAQPYIKAGFDTLANSTPDWYQDLFKWGMASALGIVSIKKLFGR